MSLVAASPAVNHDCLPVVGCADLCAPKLLLVASAEMLVEGQQERLQRG